MSTIVQYDHPVIASVTPGLAGITYLSMYGMPLRDFVGSAIYRLLRWPISQRHDTST
jgi:hypothetical protein